MYLIGAIEQRRIALVIARGEVVENSGSLGTLAGERDVLEEIAQCSVESCAGKIEKPHEALRDALRQLITEASHLHDTD